MAMSVFDHDLPFNMCRTETRSVRAPPAPAFQSSADSLHLSERASKRPKYSPSLDDARYTPDDSRSTVSMATVSSIPLEAPLVIDESFIERLSISINSPQNVSNYVLPGSKRS